MEQSKSATAEMKWNEMALEWISDSDSFQATLAVKAAQQILVWKI